MRVRLARPCVHLLRFSMTCSQFGRDQIYTKVDAPFGYSTRVNASLVTSITFYLPMKYTMFVGIFAACVYFRGNPCGLPSQVSTRSTCDYLRVSLARGNRPYWYSVLDWISLAMEAHIGGISLKLD